MLEQIDLTKKMEKEEYKAQMEGLEAELSRLQRTLREKKIPVIIVFEGFDAAGKGLQINQLIHPLDPRGFQVFATKESSEEEKRYPFLQKFFTKTPEYGRIAIFDTSWYRKISTERFEQQMAEEEFLYTCKEINTFERMLTDDGTILIKLFLSISKKEQKKRFDKLLQSKDTAWRVSKQDIKRNHSYDKYKEMMEQMLENTETVYAPWHIIEACDRRFATAKIFMTVISCIKEKMNMTKSALGNPTEKTMVSSSLSKVDLNLSYSKELYKKKLENLQKRLTVLHGELYRRKIPVILGFEGWDAGGKGGAIRRLTEAMDPRGYVVNPTAAPSGEEKNHHYLWRFWRNMPKDGHVAIFDRTWYGRVMVERIEGFCTPFEWQRAYQEINDMEASLAHHGAIVIKFWMHIDKDEQERRFRARMEDPDKNWKITDEDWRNREKWDLYEDAVNEMIIRTSTTYAPWVIVEGNNKYYARIKVLETVVNAIEKRLQK